MTVSDATVHSPAFLSPAWVDSVREALDSGPDQQAREHKLAEYWDFYAKARSEYRSTWALGVQNLPEELGDPVAYLLVGWSEDRVTECRVVRGAPPAEATYTLMADYRDWRALFGGYDALRTVMYRKMVLESGPLLEFFKAIYFFVESLTLIARVPTSFPEPVSAQSPSRRRRRSKRARPARH